ncbi:MAG: hypothetical protein GMKNLPBB_03191 [Myxococcota bacterium]|nr:hypothetical protein [Myxococcota bacterium]
MIQTPRTIVRATVLLSALAALPAWAQDGLRISKKSVKHQIPGAAAPFYETGGENDVKIIVDTDGELVMDIRPLIARDAKTRKQAGDTASIMVIVDKKKAAEFKLDLKTADPKAALPAELGKKFSGGKALSEKTRVTKGAKVLIRTDAKTPAALISVKVAPASAAPPPPAALTGTDKKPTAAPPPPPAEDDEDDIQIGALVKKDEPQKSPSANKSAPSTKDGNEDDTPSIAISLDDDGSRPGGKKKKGGDDGSREGEVIVQNGEVIPANSDRPPRWLLDGTRLIAGEQWRDELSGSFSEGEIAATIDRTPDEVVTLGLNAGTAIPVRGLGGPTFTGSLYVRYVIPVLYGALSVGGKSGYWKWTQPINVPQTATRKAFEVNASVQVIPVLLDFNINMAPRSFIQPYLALSGGAFHVSGKVDPGAVGGATSESKFALGGQGGLGVGFAAGIGVAELEGVYTLAPAELGNIQKYSLNGFNLTAGYRFKF